MYDKDVATRSTGAIFAFDQSGNLVLKSLWEMQHRKLMHQSWERYSYTNINGLSGLPTYKKSSGKEANVNVSHFEDGDFALTSFEYNDQTGTLRAESACSTEGQDFARKTFDFDDYGNEVLSDDAAGLRKFTVYEEFSHTYAVCISEEAESVSHSTLSAFDDFTGLVIATRDSEGLLSCFRLDAFRRCLESRTISVDLDVNGETASQFLNYDSVTVHHDFKQILASTQVSPHRSLAFGRHTTPSGLN